MQPKKKIDSLEPEKGPANRRAGMGKEQNCIIVESIGKDLKIRYINSLRIAERLKRSAGDIARAKRLLGGDLLVECKNKEQAGKLPKTKMLGNIKMSCQLPKFFTETAGVVYGVHQLRCQKRK